MVFPTKNAILRGFFFIIAVLIYLMCERWMLQVKVTGSPIYQSHVFNHVFLLWTMKQCLLAAMYPLWKAIDRDFLGMKCLRHAGFDEAEQEPQRRTHRLYHQDSAASNVNTSSSINATSDENVSLEAESTRIRPRPKKRNSYTKMLFFLPSVFSQAHIILVYFGLKLTYHSSVIMLTGTASMFVTLLSLAFLAKQISCFMWVGVVCSTIGFAISGLSDYLYKVPPGYEPYGIAAGDLLYTMGQITITTQMVYEEKFMKKLSIHPMKFLGSEGIYSMIFSLIMLASFCIADTDYSDLPNNKIEDIEDAALQFGNSWQIVLAVIGSLISYVVYTYLGMILIKDHGAMSRIMIEALAWCLYWVILLSAAWEQYYITQIPGLVMVPCGVLIFSHIVVCPCSRGDGTLDPSDTDEINRMLSNESNGYVPLNSEEDDRNLEGAVGGVIEDSEDVALLQNHHYPMYSHGEDEIVQA